MMSMRRTSITGMVFLSVAVLLRSQEHGPLQERVIASAPSPSRQLRPSWPTLTSGGGSSGGGGGGSGGGGGGGKGGGRRPPSGGGGGGGGGGSGGGSMPGGGSGGGGGGQSMKSTCTDLCDTTGASASIKYDYTSDSTYLKITSNGCPNHLIENAITPNPNSACKQKELTWYIPKKPVFAASVTNTTRKAISYIAVSISGTYFYGPATGPNGGDAGNQECGTFDFCSGHSDTQGQYHYHLSPYCLEQSAPRPNNYTKHSPLVGWSPDGFPLYGLYSDNGTKPQDLDDCGGHDSDSVDGYHYHMRGPMGPFPQKGPVTGYPYFPSCLKGCIPDAQPNKAQLSSVSYATCISTASSAPNGTTYAKTWRSTSYAYGYEGYSPLNRTSSAATTALSAGAVAGISVGSVVGALIMACCCWYCMCRRRRASAAPVQHGAVDGGGGGGGGGDKAGAGGVVYYDSPQPPAAYGYQQQHHHQQPPGYYSSQQQQAPPPGYYYPQQQQQQPPAYYGQVVYQQGPPSPFHAPQVYDARTGIMTSASPPPASSGGGLLDMRKDNR